MKRKTILVSLYYRGSEPDLDSLEHSFQLDTAIKDTLNRNDRGSDVFDVAIDETKPWLFSNSRWYTQYLFRLIRAR
jgi:hypothetical protein